MHHHPDDREQYWEVTTHQIVDGRITKTTAEVPNFLGCDDPDNGCIAQIAGANIANSVACASCAASAGWIIAACAMCVATTLTGVGVVVKCAEDGSWCEDRK